MLYLASTSPRRLQLLADAGIPCELVVPGPEPEGQGAPGALAQVRARSKAHGAAVDGAAGWVLGVDTVVARGRLEFGKPVDRDHAATMLRQLAGREHDVLTALCLVSHPGRRCLERLEAARVYCAPLSAARLQHHLDGGWWRGKAGGYGIQDRSCDFMRLLAGDLETVVGLPVRALRGMLAAVGATGGT